MVLILDEGGVFDAPLEKIWKLNRSKIYHKHPRSMKSMKAEQTADPSTIFPDLGIRKAGLEIQSQSKVDISTPDWIHNGFCGGATRWLEGS